MNGIDERKSRCLVHSLGEWGTRICDHARRLRSVGFRPIRQATGASGRRSSKGCPEPGSSVYWGHFHSLPAGDGHRIITGGGSSAWNDLALYLVARFCGSEEARRIAKIFLLGDRADRQLPFAHVMRPAQHSDAVIQELQDWIAMHYACSNPVARLEKRSGLTSRTMKRRFKVATGYAPIKYVQSLRIEAAKQRLESTDASIEFIAGEVGYLDPKSFRSLFKKMTSIAPSDYRRRFQSIGLYGAQNKSKVSRR